MPCLFGGLAMAYPKSQECHIMDSYPFFKPIEVTDMKSELTGVRREEVKNELVFLTELSRFLNKKAPMLLQEFAESKKIFSVKKKLGMIELEAEYKKQMMDRPKRTVTMVKLPVLMHFIGIC